MRSTNWTSGQWNSICDVCGFKFKASDIKERWDGYMVCKEDFELRHPQESIRVLPDQNKLPWTRPEPADTFITVTYNPKVITTVSS
jgi:hypothetical protein